MKKYSLLAVLFCMLCVFETAAQQPLWVAGYTEQLDTLTNGRIQVLPQEDTVLVSSFDSPVQFESTMAGWIDEDGELLFYTNGCHLYDRDHQVIPGGEELNPGEIHDIACDDYGYLAPKGASIATFRTAPNLFYLVHMGIENSIRHSVSYGPLYLTRIERDSLTGQLEVISKNEVLIEEEVDPFVLVRHGNGDDWWLITNRFATNEYHKILLTPEGVEEHQVESLGYDFPFPPCRWQRSLSSSPSGERIVRFGSKCGAQYLTFDRCSGELEDAGFSNLENGIFGGGGSTFSANSEFVYFSRWYRVIKVPFNAPPDTLRASYQPEPGFGGSFVHMHRDAYGRIYIGPQASEPYLHIIEPGDISPDTALVEFEGLRLPHRIQRTIPNYPNYALGPLSGSVCDSIPTSLEEEALLKDTEISVFPNPTRDRITVETDVQGAKTITVYDAWGRLLMTTETLEQQVDFDVSSHQPGLYLIVGHQKGQLLGIVKVILLE
jgi:hypothetical protein